MICPKCNREIEGNTCPWCDAPEILVNAEDYEKRKRQWQDNKKKTTQEETHRRNREDLQQLADSIAKADIGKVAAASPLGRFYTMHRRSFTAGLVLLLLFVVATIALSRLFPAGTQKLYSDDGANIHLGTVEEAVLCASDSVIFNAEFTFGQSIGKRKEFADKDIVDAMCSKDGKYYAIVVYEENRDPTVPSEPAEQSSVVGESTSAAVNGNEYSDGIYILYVWEKDSDIQVALQEDTQKDIQYVSEYGDVIFTDTTHLNEGAVASVALRKTRIFTQSLHTEQLAQELVRLQVLRGEQLLWLDADANLWQLDMTRQEQAAVRLSGYVSELYGLNDRNTYTPETVVTDADAVVYCTQDGEYLYYELFGRKKGTSHTLFIGEDKAQNIAVDMKYGVTYAFCGGKLDRFYIQGYEAEEAEAFQAEVKNSGDIFYHSGNHCIYYIDSSGGLYSIRHSAHGKTTAYNITGGIITGSLLTIAGSRELFAYRKADGVYLMKNMRETCLAHAQGVNPQKTGKIVLFNNKYYYLNDGTMYCAGRLGKEVMQFGTAVDLWIGKVTI